MKFFPLQIGTKIYLLEPVSINLQFTSVNKSLARRLGILKKVKREQINWKRSLTEEEVQKELNYRKRWSPPFTSQPATYTAIEKEIRERRIYCHANVPGAERIVTYSTEEEWSTPTEPFILPKGQELIVKEVNIQLSRNYYNATFILGEGDIDKILIGKRLSLTGHPTLTGMNFSLVPISSKAKTEGTRFDNLHT